MQKTFTVNDITPGTILKNTQTGTELTVIEGNIWEYYITTGKGKREKKGLCRTSFNREVATDCLNDGRLIMLAPGTVLYKGIKYPVSLVNDMRGHVLDCAGSEEAIERINEASNTSIIAHIDQTYSGGIEGFILANEPIQVAPSISDIAKDVREIEEVKAPTSGEVYTIKVVGQALFVTGIKGGKVFYSNDSGNALAFSSWGECCKAIDTIHADTPIHHGLHIL